MSNEHTERILTMIRQIPQGKVATYGQIAKLAGIPRNARQVGAILRTLQDSSVPWHRVVNSKGQISGRKSGESQSVQRQALEEEQVVFNSRGSISLAEFGWQPKLG